MTVRVLTAVDHRREAALVARLDGDAEVTVVRRCADLADLVAAASAGLADVAVVSGGLRGLDRDALAHIGGAGVVVVGLTESELEERRLRQLGVAELVAGDRAVEQLPQLLRALVAPGPQPPDGSGASLDEELAAVEAGLDPCGIPGVEPESHQDEDPEPPEEETNGRLIAVWGPSGAPGRTTVAVNVAAELAAAGARVLLIDADTYAASLAQVLGLLDESPGMAAAARAAELGTLDLPTLARLAPTAAPRLRVLTGLPSASRWTELRGESMTHLLALSRQLCDAVVVDCGFCLADPVGLQRLVRGLDELGSIQSPTPAIVVNRVRSSAVGSSPENRIAEALTRFADVEVDHFVPDDRSSLDRCVLAGRTLREEAAGSVVRERLRQVAASFLPREPSAVPSAARSRRRLSVTMGRWSTA